MSKRSSRLEALQDVFAENNITKDTIELNDALIRKIKKNADAVKDHRHPSYVKHPLGDIIMIVFFAVLANANEWSEIEVFAKSKEKWLRKYLELPYGVPTDDTYRIVMGNIDTQHFFHVTVQMLLETVDRIMELTEKESAVHEKGIVSVDGKVSRGSGRKACADGEVRAFQTLNVYADEYGMCLAQKFIEEKTNEIPAAQEVLKLMDLKETIVTADAMNCQKGTASVIKGRGGDYVLALKGNQGLLYDEVRAYFDAEVLEGLRGRKGCYTKTAEKEHGGVAVREYYISGETDWYSEKDRWEGLESFGMVHKTLTGRDGTTEEEYRYYLCSIGEDAEEFGRAARRHWGVENSLHWQMDFTFQDDRNRSMAKTGGKNLQTMKKIVLAILRLVKESYKMSMKRIRYDLSLDFENGIERLLSLLNIESIEKALHSKG